MLKKIVLLAAVTLAPLAGASQLPDYPFIHATGSAARYFLPDVGSVDFEVIVSGTDAAAAREQIEAQLSAIGALAAAQGVAPEDLQIRDVRKEIRKGDQSTIATPIYDLRCNVHITVHALDKWRDVVGPLIDMPNITGFLTEFGSSEREKVETELIAMAMKDARRRADAMADGLGKKVGAVAAVTTGALKNLGAAMGLVAADVRYSNAASTPMDRRNVLNIEMMKMAQPVDVIFRIK